MTTKLRKNMTLYAEKEKNNNFSYLPETKQALLTTSPMRQPGANSRGVSVWWPGEIPLLCNTGDQFTPPRDGALCQREQGLRFTMITKYLKQSH